MEQGITEDGTENGSGNAAAGLSLHTHFPAWRPNPTLRERTEKREAEHRPLAEVSVRVNEECSGMFVETGNAMDGDAEGRISVTVSAPHGEIWLFSPNRVLLSFQ